jgi:hypothetical protein
VHLPAGDGRRVRVAPRRAVRSRDTGVITVATMPSAPPGHDRRRYMIGPLEFVPDRSVEVYIRRLRVKLGKAAPDWDHIHTQFNIGYRLDPEPRTGRPAANP